MDLRIGGLFLRLPGEVKNFFLKDLHFRGSCLWSL